MSGSTNRERPEFTLITVSYISYSDEFCNSLVETLRYVREVAAPDEPGHPENTVTLHLFRLVRVGIQKLPYYLNEARELEKELDKLEEWVNIGGCAKVGFLLAANMATRLSNYPYRALAD